MKITKIKSLETSLVLTTAFLLIYVLTSHSVFLYLALSLGLIGIFINPLAKYIAMAWFKLADLLNFFMSKLILGSVFFIILFPLSIAYRISKKDSLQLKKPRGSNWKERKKTYTAADLENIW